MTDQQSILLEKIRQTRRCRPEVVETATQLAGLDTATYESLIRQLIAAGEDETLGVLLCSCAINQIKLAPALLSETLKVVEPMVDFAPLYRFQDDSSIPPLLEVAQAKDISWQRRAFAGLIAAEMAVSLDYDPRPVKKVLLKLKSRLRGFDIQIILDQAMELLDDQKYAADSKEWFESHRDVLTTLPDDKPPVVIGAGFTVRRPMPKIGRNAPCHCGSGKKYKKCCYEKDQKLWHDASPYEGMTMSQIRSTPELVDDTQFITEMRAYELRNLDSARLSPNQLFSAYQRADTFGLRELAFEMLWEYQQRKEPNEFDWGHFEDLLYSALDAGDVTLAEKIIDRIPAEEIHDPDDVRLTLQLQKYRDHYELLETQCRKALSEDDDRQWDDPMIRLSHGLEETFPALSIVFGRAFITGNPDRVFDNEVLLDVIRSARAEIGIDPWSDPIEEYFDWCCDNMEAEIEKKEHHKEIEQLQTGLSEARRSAAEKERELRQKEKQLNDLLNRMDKEKAKQPVLLSVKRESDSSTDAESKETIIRLRHRIVGLKSEIRSQQQIRRQLTGHLKAEQPKTRLSQPSESSAAPADRESDTPITAIKEFRKILIPDFTQNFRRSCESVPPSVVAKVVKAAAGFATQDEMIWRHTKSIKLIPEIYRIQISRDYRLMLRWIPDETLEVLDLIPRSQLETWIKQYRR